MLPEILKGKTVDALLYAPILEVESQALTQIRNIASLPWVVRYSVMPDTHFGIGAPIGSCVGMREALSPSLVGVDIGCFTGDTLVPLLDGKSYAIKELVGRQDIYVYACDDAKKIAGSKAEALLTRKNASLISVTLDNNEKIRCTPDQKFKLRDGSYVEAKDLRPGAELMPFYSDLDKDGYVLVQQPYLGSWQRAHWVIARSGLLGDIPSFAGQMTIIHHKNFIESDNRPENLQFMGNGDHASYHRNLVENNLHWQSPEFEEKRKEALAAKALTPDGHEYFHQKWEKNLSTYWDDKKEILKEICKDNGERGKEYLIDYNKSEKGKAKSKEWGNKEFTCDICGEIIKSPIGYFRNHRPACERKHNHKVISVEELPEKEDVYCLRVPTYHNFAISAGVFVHNCGMAAIKTNITADDLPDDLGGIRHSIERGIPVGFNSHNEPLSDVLKLPLWKEFDTLSDKIKKLKGKAMNQCGTLGGGNHFIELCLDTGNNVWLMLHSGSRNIGKEIAELHIAKARHLVHNVYLEDRDCAVFLANSPEMQEYRRDLYFAQRYAMENRRAMLGVFQKQMEHYFPQIRFEEGIYCHHNYVSEETHFGEKLFVTRKGAIHAGKGVFGIIPGSMGTKSYIVRGLGNPESLNSAPHGAGRRMSRGEAKRQFTQKDLEEQTAGVECRKDAGVIDEIPAAYKNIDDVIANSSTLVEVVAQLKQVMCIKG